MGIVLVIHPLLRWVYESAYNTFYATSSATDKSRGNYRMRRRISYDLIFAALFLFVLHGSSAVKVLLILSMNFLIVKRLPRSFIPYTTWIFNISVLSANELCHGYPYVKIAEVLLPTPFTQGERSWSAWLDSYGGLIPRWEILFNITVLRLISFNLDYYWSHDKRMENTLEV